MNGESEKVIQRLARSAAKPANSLTEYIVGSEEWDAECSNGQWKITPDQEMTEREIGYVQSKLEMLSVLYYLCLLLFLWLLIANLPAGPIELTVLLLSFLVAIATYLVGMQSFSSGVNHA